MTSFPKEEVYRKEFKRVSSKRDMRNDVNGVKKKSLTLGQKYADNITRIAGSWFFIIGFFVFLIIWMILNVTAWSQGWDPYPFILLNLVLSCLAAIQAPVILMSQNRAAEIDRQKANYDYAVNRKSEREIEKIKTQLNRIERRLVSK